MTWTRIDISPVQGGQRLRNHLRVEARAKVRSWEAASTRRGLFPTWNGEGGRRRWNNRIQLENLVPQLPEIPLGPLRIGMHDHTTGRKEPGQGNLFRNTELSPSQRQALCSPTELRRRSRKENLQSTRSRGRGYVSRPVSLTICS